VDFGNDKKQNKMKQSELKQLIKEEITQQKLLEEKNKKASKINQNLSNLIEKMKKDFNIEDEQF
jgi:hypothetical protein